MIAERRERGLDEIRRQLRNVCGFLPKLCPLGSTHLSKICVRFYLNLFYIERGLHSRTEIGEREINGSTVHNVGAVVNRTLFSCLPLPPPLMT